MAYAKRDWRLDLVRSLALVDVVSVHFLLNSGFYSSPVVGVRMAAMVLLRAFTIICVPLFMLLTGYLVKGSVLRDYYRRILPIAYTYIIATALCGVYAWVFLGDEPSILGFVWGLLGFSAAPYSWYVEMYVGLFLLVPFLSMLWDALEKRQRKALIATVLVVMYLPNLFNTFNLSDPGWWMDPQSSGSVTKVLPAWWVGAYPIGYYFVGR